MWSCSRNVVKSTVDPCSKLIRVKGRLDPFSIEQLPGNSYLEPLGLPEFYGVSLLACHGLMTPADLHILANIECFCVAFGVR